MDETSQVPRKERLHVHKVSDCARFFPCKPFAMGRCCLLFSGMSRHLGIRPVSQLNTWPVASPVTASRRPSRDAAHHSGSGRMASPYPMGDFHLLFFASFLAHSESGRSLPKCVVGDMSDLPPVATDERTWLDVSNVPISHIAGRPQVKEAN